MRLARNVLFLALAASFFPATPAAAQQALDRPLRVFLDCNEFPCDQSFYTQEVPWVTFVRDRQSADVHVLGTRQSTGVGGSAYTLEFRGRESFAGDRVTLRTITLPDVTESERRSELVRVVQLGLAPFAAGTSQAPVVDFGAADPGDGSGAVVVQDDPWDRWVFRVGVDGFANAESQQSFMNGSGSVNASRVTAEWKVQLGVRGSTNRSEYELEEGREVFSTESYSGNGMAVKSLGQHWGAGAIAEWRRSTFSNYDHSAAVGAAVEYNFFPYVESTRRLLTLTYAIGPRYNVYQDSTIFAETEELLIHQILGANYDVTQPWGNIDVSASLDHYVTKFGDGRAWEDPQYNASLSGGFNLRLIRGLSTRVHGSVGMVRGQIQLAAGELSEDEILTRQRELATNYRYFLSFGLSYRFGSIFSDVVNPRFDDFL